MKYKSLSREEIKKVIEGRGAAERIPMMYHFWSGAHIFGEDGEKAAGLMEMYPNDLQAMYIRVPEVFEAPEDDPDFKWIYKDKKADENVGIDAKIAIDDWDELDDILAHFPNPDYHGVLTENFEPDGRYRLAFWWNGIFERFWSLRGMENALMDFYLYPEEVHRLFRAITDYYLRNIERAATELNADGVMFSDDIGTQKAPFFSEAIFLEFFKPYYKEMADKAHSLGVHLWMHACGNIQLFLPHLIEIGLDVIHPIQKYTMDQKEIAEKFGNDICIWAGFDVQQVIPYGTPDEVRKEVRRMIDTYKNPNGRFMLTCGNSLTPDCRIESFEALLDESYHYGSR